MDKYPTENHIPINEELPDNIREVITLILSKLGYSAFEIHQQIAEYEASGLDQITLYDVNKDTPHYEQLLFDETGLTSRDIRDLVDWNSRNKNKRKRK